MRKFEIVKNESRKFLDTEIKLPKRASINSAGYDFYNNGLDIEVLPNAKYLFWTDVKVQLNKDELLSIYIRSSLAIKNNLELVNQVGIVDSDYYSNESNDGNIGICIRNIGDISVVIKHGDRIAQGVITKFFITEDDTSNEVRIGGIGSTGDN